MWKKTKNVHKTFFRFDQKYFFSLTFFISRSAKFPRSGLNAFHRVEGKGNEKKKKLKQRKRENLRPPVAAFNSAFTVRGSTLFATPPLESQSTTKRWKKRKKMSGSPRKTESRGPCKGQYSGGVMTRKKVKK